ncbi:GMP synthase-Glutamine amidotransferase [Ectothiorhodospira mobilis]|uniref:GMP synthase-Glutamine amidotransferase n=1 Tax=Ectothiorhodospira mobilis TaxID=195064 RepID=A0A1I4SLI1_ECTMO|nr:GMP synthase [Ectothiorhodospira mobilis]SFM65210.1 GMP synthase-Glutamine amidotransferase [Ectothiorhodospira mobilis]
MKQYAVVQHSYAEFLGLIETQLEQRDIGFRYFRPFVGPDLPGSAAQFDGLWLLGGPQWPAALEEELGLIQAFRAARRPVVGLGLGGLLVARAAGGLPREDAGSTCGFCTARRTEAGAGDALAEALDGREVLVLRQGQVDPPPGLEPLLVDDRGRWLAIRPDALTYGLLCRPEMKPGMLEDLVMDPHHEPPADIGDCLDQARARWPAMQETTDRVVAALVSELQLMRERRKMPVFSLKVE